MFLAKFMGVKALRDGGSDQFLRGTPFALVFDELAASAGIQGRPGFRVVGLLRLQANAGPYTAADACRGRFGQDRPRGQSPGMDPTCQ
jgi:hypothetical protein